MRDVTRLSRRNRTDIKIAGSGGILDLVDNVVKEAFRIDDDEYDYIAEQATDDELTYLLQESVSFSDKRILITILQKYMTRYYAEI